MRICHLTGTISVFLSHPLPSRTHPERFSSVFCLEQNLLPSPALACLPCLTCGVLDALALLNELLPRVRLYGPPLYPSEARPCPFPRLNHDRDRPRACGRHSFRPSPSVLFMHGFTALGCEPAAMWTHLAKLEQRTRRGPLAGRLALRRVHVRGAMLGASRAGNMRARGAPIGRRVDIP